MVLKLWDGKNLCWIFWDKVRKIHIEGNWTFLKSDRYDELNKVYEIDGIFPLYVPKENRERDSKQKINTSVRGCYDADYRSDEERTFYNMNEDQDSYYTVNLVCMVFADGRSESVICKSSDIFLMNDEGKTIERLN
jgi:hypothetical protein